MNRLFAFAALLLITSVASAGTITTTFDESTPGGAPAGIIVFDINIANTDNWVGTELVYTNAGATVHQELAFPGMFDFDVSGLAGTQYDGNYNGGWDTFFLYPGIVQAAGEVLPTFMPAPLNQPTGSPDLSVGWYDAGNTLSGSHKIGQLALDLPEGAWLLAETANETIVGTIELISRVKDGESIVIERQTLLVTEVPEPTTMVLLLFGALGLLGLRRRK